MNYNNKRLEKASKFIHYLIAITLCGFLIAFSGLIMEDANNLKDAPILSAFEDENYIEEQEFKKDSIALIDKSLTVKLQLTNKLLSTAKLDHNNAKESFDVWLDARKTLGSTAHNGAVLKRANELDDFYAVEKMYLYEVDSIEQLIQLQHQNSNALQELIWAESENAYSVYSTEKKSYELNIFLIRLAIIFPILILAIFFAFKFRKHKYWPLFLGFILFALYAFFFGLVPYLPSYGGYIRYSVGVLICLGVGIYFINKIRSFIERKRSELKVSQTERANKVQIETAEKALDNHMCPSCGKGFVIKSWQKLPGKQAKMQRVLATTSYCRFCGLVLFKDCKFCGTENFAHLPFCSKCGENVKEIEQ